MDATLRMEGLPALMLWDAVSECLQQAGGDPRQSSTTKLLQTSVTQSEKGDAKYMSEIARYNQVVRALIQEIDFVPPSMPLSSGKAQLFVFEDNEAVIKNMHKRAESESQIRSENS